MNIGEMIKYWRTEKGITQKQLAEDAGISEISIRKYEANERTPKIGTIRKISKALNVQISDIDTNLLLAEFISQNDEVEQKRRELFERERQTGQTFKDELAQLNIENTDLLDSIIYLKELKKENAIKKYQNSKLLNAFNSLNKKGQSKALEQVEMLTKIPEYRKDTE